MAGFQAKLNDWIIPTALGAALYFLQSIAKDNNELAKNVAVMARRQDDIERRVENCERVCSEGPKRWPSPVPR